MHEVPANAYFFSISLQGGPISAGLKIVELQMLMDEIANGLHAAPAFLRRSKQVPCDFRELAIHFAVAAGKEKSKDGCRQLVHAQLAGGEIHRVSLSVILNDRVICEADGAGRKICAAAEVAKRIEERGKRDIRTNPEAFGFANPMRAGRMNREREECLCRGGQVEFDLVAEVNKHILKISIALHSILRVA